MDFLLTREVGSGILKQCCEKLNVKAIREKQLRFGNNLQK